MNFKEQDQDVRGIIVTVPKNREKSIEAENRLAAKGLTQFWSLSRKPKRIKVGHFVFFVKKGFIDNYQEITGMAEGKEHCEVTGLNYNGVFLYLKYPPIYLARKHSYKPFRGFRYIGRAFMNELTNGGSK